MFELLTELILQTKKTTFDQNPNYFRKLGGDLQDRSLTRERRRQIVIEQQDYQEELALNQLKQAMMAHCKPDFELVNKRLSLS